MGTTFFVLILLSLIIAAFGRIFTSLEKKRIEDARKKDEEAKKNSDSFVDAVPAVKQGSLAPQEDDGALIAVIAAAVSAYREQAEPAAARGFVVRKIRRIEGNNCLEIIPLFKLKRNKRSYYLSF